MESWTAFELVIKLNTTSTMSEILDETPEDTYENSLKANANKPKQKFHHFIAHKKGKKIEVVKDLIPGVVSYTFDPDNVTPRDIGYILDTVATIMVAKEIENQISIKLQPKTAREAIVILDIKNRANIDIGMMNLGRWH